MIYIIRHGQTSMNKARVLQGRSSNAPLNETGEIQAEETAKWFAANGISFDEVWSSPLGRAMQTARIIAGDVPVRTDERLIEMDYGPFEGAGLSDPPPEIIEFFSDFVNNPAPAGMEPLADVVERSGSFLEDISSQWKDKTVLISTHAIAMKGVLEYLTPDSCGAYWRKFIGNCAVYSFDILEDGGFSVPECVYPGAGR